MTDVNVGVRFAAGRPQHGSLTVVEVEDRGPLKLKKIRELAQWRVSKVWVTGGGASFRRGSSGVLTLICLLDTKIDDSGFRACK
jgi:hypothetical protein